VLLQRCDDFSSILDILNRTFRYSHSLKKSPQLCPRFGAKIVKSLRSPNGDNSACPIHPAEYRCRFSPWTSKHKITMREVYAILQNHFRSVTISRTQQSPLASAHGIGVDDLTSVNFIRAVHDLLDEIHAKDKQICNYQQIIHGAERSIGKLALIIREKDEDIRESHEKLSQAEHAIVEMMEQQLELNVPREREISELPITIEGLEQEIVKKGRLFA
jgi:hypothetical protein